VLLEVSQALDGVLGRAQQVAHDDAHPPVGHSGHDQEAASGVSQPTWEPTAAEAGRDDCKQLCSALFFQNTNKCCSP
jgi:hypothetical protein